MGEAPARFSASDAALEGVDLVRRHWRVLVGWAVFNLLALFMVTVVAGMTAVVAAAMSGAGRAVGPATIFLIGTVFVQAIIAGGVFRLEQRPQEPGFLHLRVGGDELRLVIIWLVTLVAAGVVLSLAQAAAGALLGAGGRVAALLVALAVTVYFGVRFSLAAPASFAEGRLAFASSWRLTRGRVRGLLGMLALTFSLMGLLMLVGTVVMVVIAGLAGGLEAIGSLFVRGGESFSRHPGLLGLYAAVEILLTPVFWALALGPLIAAYRALGGEGGRS